MEDKKKDKNKHKMRDARQPYPLGCATAVGFNSIFFIYFYFLQAHIFRYIIYFYLTVRIYLMASITITSPFLSFSPPSLNPGNNVLLLLLLLLLLLRCCCCCCRHHLLPVVSQSGGAEGGAALGAGHLWRELCLLHGSGQFRPWWGHCLCLLLLLQCCLCLCLCLCLQCWWCHYHEIQVFPAGFPVESRGSGSCHLACGLLHCLP